MGLLRRLRQVVQEEVEKVVADQVEAEKAGKDAAEAAAGAQVAAEVAAELAEAEAETEELEKVAAEVEPSKPAARTPRRTAPDGVPPPALARPRSRALACAHMSAAARTVARAGRGPGAADGALSAAAAEFADGCDARRHGHALRHDAAPSRRARPTPRPLRPGTPGGPRPARSAPRPPR